MIREVHCLTGFFEVAECADLVIMSYANDVAYHCRLVKMKL